MSDGAIDRMRFPRMMAEKTSWASGPRMKRLVEPGSRCSRLTEARVAMYRWVVVRCRPSALLASATEIDVTPSWVSRRIMSAALTTDWMVPPSTRSRSAG